MHFIVISLVNFFLLSVFVTKMSLEKLSVLVLNVFYAKQDDNEFSLKHYNMQHTVSLKGNCIGKSQGKSYISYKSCQRTKIKTNNPCISKISRNHIITSCIKSRKITTNLTNPYFILAMFWTCFFCPFSSFNDKKVKLQGLQ